MNDQGMNVFIVDENQQMDIELKQTLAKRFGKSVTIFTFHTEENCLKKVDENTRFVILVSFKKPDRKDEMVKSIKLINPKTEVIILSYNDNIEKVIESFRAGAADYIIKDSNVKRNVIADIYWKISEPLRKMGREFGLPKYTGIFIATVVSMAVIVLIVLKVIPR